YLTFPEKLASYRPFFDWLDHPIHRPNDQPECSLQLLDTDTVEYLPTEEDRLKYRYGVNEEGLMEHFTTENLLSTSAKGFMFVLKDGAFYICEKRTTTPRFHHSSFLGGEPVNFAGIMICEEGRLVTVFPHSGHYRPEDKHLLWF